MARAEEYLGEQWTTKALHDNVIYTERALNAKLAMEEDVHSTKHVARHVCYAYHKKALLIAMDKSKLLYLTYCMMVLVIALLVVVVILKF